MNGLTEEQLLLRNLKDAGCSEADIERYLKLRAEGKELEQSPFSLCPQSKTAGADP